MLLIHYNFYKLSAYSSMCWETVCVSMCGDSLSALLCEVLCILQHRQSQCHKKEALIHGDMYGTVLSHSRYI